MIPILFDKTATNFATYGIGALSDTISCVVTEERNGLYELEMQYPTSGIHFSEIENSAIILAKPNESQNAQAFRIYQIESPINEVCTIRAEHISYQLNHIPVDCFSATGISDAFVKLKQYSLTQNPFTFYTDKTSQSLFQNKLPKSARALLGGEAGSFLQKFKGEYLWDNWTVSLLNARGSDNGVILRYGKNITDFNKDENYSDTVTGICPYWTNEGTVLVGDITKVNTTLPYDRIEVMDVSSDIELPDEGEGVVAPTKAQVTAAGAQELNNKSYIGVPATNITISFVALWQTEEYKDIAPLERVGLCDTVTVIYEKYGVSKKEKVIKTVYDTLLERYNEIEIGDPHYNLATSFASVLSAIEDNNDHILLEVSRRKDGDEAMSAKIDITAEQIQSTVAKTQKEWDTTGYNIIEFGYDSPMAEGYDPAEYTGKYYLNQTDGYLYRSNGSSWFLVKACSSVQAALQSQITQTAGQIELKVSKGDVSSQLSVESGQITLSSGRLVINSGNFQLDSGGNATATNFLAKNQVKFVDSNGNYPTYLKPIYAAGQYQGLGFYSDLTGSNFSDIVCGDIFGDIVSARRVYADSAIYVDYSPVITAENIGSQSVSYANNAGSVSWSNVSGKPSIPSSTNDIGADYNGRGITFSGVQSGTYRGATIQYVDDKTASDIKLKQNIRDMSDIKDRYMGLRPKSFQFNPMFSEDNEKCHNRYGLIAQDVMSVDTDLVTQNNTVPGTINARLCGSVQLGINYQDLHAWHIQMIQSQQRKIEELENRTKILEEER